MYEILKNEQEQVKHPWSPKNLVWTGTLLITLSLEDKTQ